MTLKIRYGFLTGNLFDGWTTEELAGIDPAASVRRYTDLCEEAIRKAFPDAQIEIACQHASGIVPANIATCVIDPGQSSEEQGEREATVDEIGSEVYEAQLWIVSA